MVVIPGPSAAAAAAAADTAADTANVTAGGVAAAAAADFVAVAAGFAAAAAAANFAAADLAGAGADAARAVVGAVSLHPLAGDAFNLDLSGEVERFRVLRRNAVVGPNLDYFSFLDRLVVVYPRGQQRECLGLARRSIRHKKKYQQYQLQQK